MVQNKTKGLKFQSRKARPKAANSGPKKGKKFIAPKKATLLKERKTRKALTAKINKSIEQQMIEASAGNLSIVRDNSTSAATSRKGSNKNSKS